MQRCLQLLAKRFFNVRQVRFLLTVGLLNTFVLPRKNTVIAPHDQFKQRKMAKSRDPRQAA